MSARAIARALLVLLALGARAAYAHKPSDSLLSLTPDADSGAGAWDFAIRDLDDAFALDADGDGAVTWGELRAGAPAFTAHALAHLALATPRGACRPSAGPVQIVDHSDGAYARLPLRLGCPSAAPLTLDYTLFFDRDPLHRGLVSVEGAAPQALILSARDHRRTVAFAAAGSAAPTTSSPVPRFVVEGVRHIWEGLDHVLFLLALLLPAVLRRERGAWISVAAIRPALADVAKIVTAFTAAHSLTLSLAALGLLRLPARLVEPAIAASVAIAAVNNLRPLFGRDRWVVAFALGLLHGFGFSSVLADVGLPRGHLLGALFGFNAGVELGQLAIVAAFVPLAYLARRTVAYRRFALVGGSAVIAAISVLWIVERVLGTSLLG